MKHTTYDIKASLATILCSLALMLSTSMLCACGGGDGDSDEDELPTPAATSTAATFPRPDWTVTLDNGHDDLPAWSAPDPHRYSGSMTGYVVLPDGLSTAEGAAEKDLLAAFCGDECRALTTVEPGMTRVPILIMGNEGETSAVTFRYYSHSQRLIYVASAATTFAIDKQFGAITPTFATSKYPVSMTATLHITLNDDASGTAQTTPQSADDLISAHVGGQCRAVAAGNPSGIYTLVILGESEGETVTIEYYSAATQHKFTATLTLKNGPADTPLTLNIIKE